jgi:hypothetical protein
MRRSALIVFISLLVLVAPKDRNAQGKASDGPCKIGNEAAATGFWTWAPNSRVRVYIRTADFDGEQQAHLLAALNNWSSVSDQTSSGVKFEYEGDTAQQRVCANCLTILRDRVFDKKTRHPLKLEAYSAADNRIITTATIFVDPILTNPKALLNALVHELGHNMGLLDCYTCKHNSTVMNQFGAVNVSNEMEKPTSCDVDQVKKAYKELKELASAMTEKRRPIVVDEGEDPVDDDTPIVVPAPSRVRPPALPE